VYRKLTALLAPDALLVEYQVSLFFFFITLEPRFE